MLLSANQTDYKARVAMVNQDKNKYQTPKYRFVVRLTNKDVICQIFSSDIEHDICIASAYSHELKRYGLTVGLTNYAAAYATGLLLARRIDAKFKLGYKGSLAVDGKEYHVKADPRLVWPPSRPCSTSASPAPRRVPASLAP